MTNTGAFKETRKQNTHVHCFLASSSLALTSAGASCAAKTLARAEIFVVTRKEYAHIRTKGNKRKVEVEVEGKAEEENGLPGIAPR